MANLATFVPNTLFSHNELIIFITWAGARAVEVFMGNGDGDLSSLTEYKGGGKGGTWKTDCQGGWGRSSECYIPENLIGIQRKIVADPWSFVSWHIAFSYALHRTYLRFVFSHFPFFDSSILQNHGCNIVEWISHNMNKLHLCAGGFL